ARVPRVVVALPEAVRTVLPYGAGRADPDLTASLGGRDPEHLIQAGEVVDPRLTAVRRLAHPPVPVAEVDGAVVVDADARGSRGLEVGGEAGVIELVEGIPTPHAGPEPDVADLVFLHVVEAVDVRAVQRPGQAVVLGD